jgi:hypothetical protein
VGRARTSSPVTAWVVLIMRDGCRQVGKGEGVGEPARQVCTMIFLRLRVLYDNLL